MEKGVKEVEYEDNKEEEIKGEEDSGKNLVDKDRRRESEEGVGEVER